MATPLKPLDPATHRRLASLTQVWILEGLAERSPWKLEDLVFQGGTSLALAWSSPRFSEDLDFIARQDLPFEATMVKVSEYVEEGLQQEFPGATVMLRSKVKPDNPNAVFFLAVALPGVMGKAQVKTEFWRVKPELVKGYDGQYTALAGRGRMKPITGVASPEQILVDKVLAVGARDRLKWRDLFDLWFLDQRRAGAPDLLTEPARFRERLAATQAMYSVTPDQLREGWERFLAMPETELMIQAARDLKPWIPEQTWARLWPDTVKAMVQGAREKILQALDHTKVETAPEAGRRRRIS